MYKTDSEHMLSGRKIQNRNGVENRRKPTLGDSACDVAQCGRQAINTGVDGRALSCETATRPEADPVCSKDKLVLRSLVTSLTRWLELLRSPKVQSPFALRFAVALADARGEHGFPGFNGSARPLQSCYALAAWFGRRYGRCLCC